MKRDTLDITAVQIEQVVALFYTRVRQHRVLGPIFAAKVTDWPQHEAKIAGFWGNALLRTPAYRGNPMMVHMAVTQIKADHFAIWLALFDDCLDQTLPPATAQIWSHLAHRIGRGMRLGIETRDHTSGPPKLF